MILCRTALLRLTALFAYDAGDNSGTPCFEAGLPERAAEERQAERSRFVETPEQK
jgi:hypothetical protein